MKLYYFDAPGKAEAIRLLLTHAGIKFEDIRFTKDNWGAHKDKFELKQVPVLEDNGKMYCQTTAILEYLGMKYGYLPKNNLEKFYNIMKVIGVVEDLYMMVYPMMSPFFGMTEEAKEESKTKLLKDFGPKALKSLEDILCANKSIKYIVGGKYTIADFVLLGAYRTLKTNENWNTAFFSKFIKKAPILYSYLEERMKDFNTYYKVCKLKLYYFDIPGKAEMIRMVLKYLKLEFEDIRYKEEGEWPAVKATGKFELGQVPALECQPCGSMLYQSDAIMQAIGHECGLLPKDPEELYKVLWWCNTAKDIMDNCWRYYAPLTEEKKKEVMTNLVEKLSVNFFSAMEERLKANGGENLVGKETTIAEFWLVGVYRACLLDDAFKDVKVVMEKYPTLKAFIEKKHQEY